MSTSRLVLVVAALIGASLATSGCERVPPHLPPTFRLDALRYWWEGEDLIVNATFTYVANFTAGEDTLYPQISMQLWEEKAKPGRVGQQTEITRFGNIIDVSFSPLRGAPWQQRFNRSVQVGPVSIHAGEPKSIEFQFASQDHFVSTTDGYYHIEVDMPAFYPPYMEHGEGIDNLFYTTGCFNHGVREFYGVKDPGADCRIWDCTGSATMWEHDLTDLHPRHDCPLTDHDGP